MPTVVTHAAVGLGLAALYATQPMPFSHWALAAGLAMLPDADVLAFRLGLPYGSRFGHRGFFHSLFFALLTCLPLALICYQPAVESWWQLWAFFFGVMASHGILDAFTNGGMGIALLAPFDDNRYFFAWRPLQVAMIGVSFFHPWNLRAFGSELMWVWVPLGLVVGEVVCYRLFFGA
jgi:inner membrane protein